MINNLQNIQYIKPNELKNNQVTHRKINLNIPNDSFEKNSSENNDKSNNGKFDISECAKNFVKGLISPLTAIIKHPVATVAIVGATALACTLVPVLGPITAIGFGALSVFQIGKGIYNVVKNYKNGEYDNAEKSFEQVGQGTIGTAMSLIGLKQSAKIAKEAKLMNDLKTTSLTQAQKEAIAIEVKNGSIIDALKEVGSLFTSKTGLKAVASQFKPSNIVQRGKDAFKFLFRKEKVTKIKQEKVNFKDTPEGQRRANLTTEQIEAEVKALYKEACDEYGIPEELRPEIKIIKEDAIKGGGYTQSKHSIIINENSYKEGIFDLPDIIKHETTHANEAILRQRLSMQDKEKIAQEYLLNKIKNGDNENILSGQGNIFTGNETMKPPKLNAKMKSDFSKFAQDKLYQTTKRYTEEELVQMIRPIAEQNPEFISNYTNADDAVNALAKYAYSHHYRYNLAIKNCGFNTSGVDSSLLTQLSEEERQLAIKSYIGGIESTEGNAANYKGILSLGSGDFNQYQFSSEEVLAQQRGNNFEISKLQLQLEKLRATENYDLGEEARLLELIKKSELTIKYKTKGMEFYKLYTESINHPENTELAAKVSAMQEELNVINSQINNISETRNILGKGLNVTVNEHTPYTVKVRPELGASVNIPPSATNAADILADNIQNQ